MSVNRLYKRLQDEDIKLCNCSRCKRLLLGPSMLRIPNLRLRLPALYKELKAPRAYVHDRPVCHRCYTEED